MMRPGTNPAAAEEGEAVMIQTGALQWRSRTDAPTGVRIYRLEGVLTDSEESFAFLTRVRQDLRADPRPVLLDLAGVPRLTSTGVGIVLAVLKSARGAGHSIALATLSRHNEMILEIAQTARFVAAFADEHAALEGCAAGAWEREA